MRPMTALTGKCCLPICRAIAGDRLDCRVTIAA